MADEGLKISLYISGQKELNDLIKTINGGNSSIDQQSRAMKLMSQAWNSWDADTRTKFGPAVKQAFTAVDNLRAGTDRLTTAVSKNRESYFTLGQALRQHTMDNLMASRAFGPYVSQMVQGVQTIQSMKTAYQESAAAGLSSGKAIEMGAMAASAGMVALAASALMAIYHLKDFAVTGARVEMLRGQLDLLVKGEGTSAVKLMNDLTKATAGHVSELEILQAVMQFKLVGTPLADLPKLLTFAEDRAKLLNRTFGEVIDSLLRVEMGGGKRAARQLGLMVDVDEAEAKYAATLGKTHDKLNDLEKRTAFYKAVLEAAGTQQDVLAGATTKTMDAIHRLDTAWENLKNNISGKASIFSGFWDEWANKLILITTMLQWMDTWGKKFVTTVPKMGPTSPTVDFFLSGVGAQVTPPSALAAEKERIELLKEREKVLKRISEILEKNADIEFGGRFQIMLKALKSQPEIAEMIKNAETMREYTKLPSAVRGFLNIQGQREGIRAEIAGFKPIKGEKEKTIQEIISEEDMAQNRAEFIAHTIRHGFQDAVNVLTQGLEKAIGLGSSLADRLAGTLLQAGLSLGLSYIPFIGPLLAGAYNKGFGGTTPHAVGDYWINEPMVARGMRTGSLHTFGEQGPEHVSTMNQMGQQARFGGGGQMQPYVKVIPITDNQGLAVRVEVGNRINKSNRRF